jgi:hypothetical protein
MMFNSFEILPFNTCYCLTEVTACEGLTVVGYIVLSLVNRVNCWYLTSLDGETFEDHCNGYTGVS